MEMFTEHAYPTSGAFRNLGRIYDEMVRFGQRLEALKGDLEIAETSDKPSQGAWHVPYPWPRLQAS